LHAQSKQKQIRHFILVFDYNLCKDTKKILSLQPNKQHLTMEYEFILRIFTAAILGGLIGLEREWRAKEAGLRTHFLVALGSAVFMIVSAYGFRDVVMDGMTSRWDVSRVAAQVVSGIGFIGAGTIIFRKAENIVSGLTTAAGLWVTAAIGLACGGGMYILASVSTVLVLFGLEAFNFLLHKIDKKRDEKRS
jgi:putative Mg2+ transporter-C (MgtC) family protein